MGWKGAMMMQQGRPAGWMEPEREGYTFRPDLGFTPPNSAREEIRSLRMTGNFLGFTLILYLLLSMTGSGLLARLLSGIFPDIILLEDGYAANLWVGGLITMLGTVVRMVVPFWLYCRLLHMPRRVAIPIRRPDPTIMLPGIFICLGVAALAGLCSQYLAYLSSRLFGAVPVVSGILITADPEHLLLSLVNLILLPALLEEMVFRGVVMQSLRRYGDTFALIVSSLLFMCIHGNFAQAPNALLMGIAIGYFVLRTGSIWTGVLIHFVNNLLVVMLEIISRLAPAGLQGLLTTALYVLYLASALIALLYVCRRHSDMFAVRPSEKHLTTGMKITSFFSSLSMLLACLLMLLIFLSNFQPIAR